MGFAPREIDCMSMWEFAACIDGYNRAHGGNKPSPPTAEEHDEYVARTLN